MRGLSMNKHEKIEFLLRCRFGSLAPPPPMTLGSTRTARDRELSKEHDEKLLLARSSYEQMSSAEIDAEYLKRLELEKGLHLGKLRAEEKKLFFNQPNATADFSHWRKMALWHLDEAVALSLGKNPTIVKWETISKHGDRYVPEAWDFSTLPKQYARHRDLVLRAKTAGQLSDPIKPAAFMAWAIEVLDHLPDELITAYPVNSSSRGGSLDRFPLELRAAIEAFEAVRNDAAALAGRSPRKALETWLKQNRPEITANARERIATVANWQPIGGAPKTPGE
jgi:hypothetical protein